MTLLKSLPSRERGLKYKEYDEHGAVGESLPSRERGLKFEAVNETSAD